MRNIPLLPIVFLFLAAPEMSRAVEIHTTFPNEIAPDERYVFYLHGLIVEGENPKPVHEKHGIYDFPAIKEKLFEGGGFNLIAHHRANNTDIEEYVEAIVGWVSNLSEAGVSASRITIIGFSRGSHLAAFASSRLSTMGINTALLASCIDGDIPSVKLKGHLLSIYEVSDIPGSCKMLAARSQLLSFKEIAINTGKAHGAFFKPLEEWLHPLKDWINETNR